MQRVVQPESLSGSVVGTGGQIKRILALIALFVLGTGCTRTTSVSKCMTEADWIISEVQEHRGVYDAAGQFGTPLGQRPLAQLLDRDQEMISCIASDPANLPHYREALDLDDTVKTYRYMQFLNETEQMQDFGRWEHQKQLDAVTVASGKSTMHGHG